MEVEVEVVDSEATCGVLIECVDEGRGQIGASDDDDFTYVGR